ncbi:transcription repressor KAN1 [Arabidopsis lyrata subsp. lyrata]|uniref:transcription repressor KAN1 n=1 Tax=Arabidopsis lyrata subsp. lyrata TaxID=81972 RepID=UPI000A29D8AB|nr:transcription repressor KAN1 [Arabidopsis lyrata subsp. lyrata]|eukprot:XP_020886266.1 transcription repressor KAN1 [Arabidopsis lyrata subsp. lyrata]
MKKKEKGKEIVTFEENPSTSIHHLDHFDHTKKVSMLLSEQEIEVILQKSTSNKETYKENLQKSKKDNAQKVGIEEGNGSSSKITPCIFYTSDEKARLRWSRDLHDCFVTAVEKLGGPDKATPKSVKETMEVEGIALHHVKSHLQKFRLGKCNIRDGTNQYIRQSQSMPGLSTIPTQQQLQLNESCVIHDSYRNATFSSAPVPPTIDPLDQDTLPASVSHHTYISSYPSYNTLEVVRAQLNALQNSSTNQTQETSSRETNLSSSVTRDEVDPVDKYIDWAKVEESGIGLDPVEVFKALGFGVSP